jgi:hypothetical protein
MGEMADYELECEANEEDYEMTHKCKYCGQYLYMCCCEAKDYNG